MMWPHWNGAGELSHPDQDRGAMVGKSWPDDPEVELVVVEPLEGPSEVAAW